MLLWALSILIVAGTFETVFGASYSTPHQNNFFGRSSSQVRSDVWTPIAVMDSNLNPTLTKAVHSPHNATFENTLTQARHQHSNVIAPTKQTYTQIPLTPSPVAEIKNYPQRIIQVQRQNLPPNPKLKLKHFNKNKRRRGGQSHPMTRIPSLFLRKTSRKVFFPSDRRTSLDRPINSNPNPNPPVQNYKFRFDSPPHHGHGNTNKFLFSGAHSGSGSSGMPIQNISNRLRSQPLFQLLCAFQTHSVGINGERCIEV